MSTKSTLQFILLRLDPAYQVLLAPHATGLEDIGRRHGMSFKRKGYDMVEQFVAKNTDMNRLFENVLKDKT